MERTTQCPKCKGKGYVLAWQQVGEVDHWDVTQDGCNECGATGYIETTLPAKKRRNDEKTTL